MRSLTLATARPTLKRVLECCETDAKIPLFANEAQERLLNRPDDPIGSVMRYRTCIGDVNCLVLPRQIRAVKAWWLCNTPGQVRSEWFEAIGYAEGGYGLRDEENGCGCSQLIDRGRVCSFANVVATTAEPRKIQAVASDPSDNGKTIHLRYIDANAIDRRETLTLSTSGVLTTYNVATNGLYHVTKQSTNHRVFLYSWDVNSAVQASQLAIYEPSETEPIYRSYFVPGLSNAADDDDDCATSKTLEVLAKLQHVPVAAENDPFVIGNLAALKLMCKGIMMEERHELEMAEGYFASAAREIDGEIQSYLTEGMLMQVRAPDVDTWGPGVMNAI
jgi:hypothetical protein